jgi:NAD(P)H-nitrite reductase large subunit
MSSHYLIIGNGAAGLSAAEMVRQRDKNGRITILTNEPYGFYSRPGIAYFVLGQISEKQIVARNESFYREHRFDLRFAQVIRLDIEQQVVHLDDGESLSYDVALLATGSTAVPASFPGGDLQGVLTFDTLDNAKQVVNQGKKAKAAVVVGGGITAMELAEGLRHQGARTHFLQRGDRLWPRLFDERESAIIEHQVHHEGIELHYKEEIEEAIGKNGRVAGVRLKSGKEIGCQIIGVAIGVRPNLQLVKGGPVKLDKGVLVNNYMQSNVPTLFAAGDVAQVYDRWTEQHQLDVLWPSAINTGRVAGYNMVDVARGAATSYAYRKGSPFNAALLFGIHLTVIGRVGSEGGRVENAEELSYLSRGASNVWTAPFSSSYRSAWDKKGTNSIRVVVSEGRLVGALLLGNQDLADPLRYLIEQEIPLGPYEAALATNGPELPRAIWQLWRQTQPRHNGQITTAR